MDWQALWNTLWSWLPLLGLVGFISGIFTLKDRFRNWLGARNKKSFEKRLRELENLMIFVESYKDFPPNFFAHVLDKIMPVIFAVLSAFTLLVIGLFNFIFSPQNQLLIFVSLLEFK